MRRNSQKGFTLIELLIVIAIIGILAAVLIPNLLQARARAQDAAAQSCAKEILTQAEIYNIDNQTYPADETALVGDYAPVACQGNNVSAWDATGNATTISGTVTSNSTAVFNYSNSGGISK